MTCTNYKDVYLIICDIFELDEWKIKYYDIKDLDEWKIIKYGIKDLDEWKIK